MSPNPRTRLLGFGGLVVAGGIWFLVSVHVRENGIAELSATLDREIEEWAAWERPRPLLFGEAVPGGAMEFYNQAFTLLGPSHPPQGSTVTELGKARDQIVPDEVFDLLSKGARTAAGVRPASLWDGRPLLCDPDMDALDRIVMQIRSETTWGRNARVRARRENPPSDGPSQMFHVERMLAFLRMTDDLALAAGGACRPCLTRQAWVALSSGMRFLDDGLLTVEEATVLLRGLETLLASLAAPETRLEELNLVTQSGFRAALAGDRPDWSYPWGHAAEGLLGTRGRIYEAWKQWRGLRLNSPDAVLTLPARSSAVLREAWSEHSPAEILKSEREWRRRLEQYVLGLRAFLYIEAKGGPPVSVEEIRPAVVRGEPDGGRWMCGCGRGFPGEWEIWWVGPDGSESWRLGIRKVE